MKINLTELQNAPEKKLDFYFDEILDELKNNNPVRGYVYAKIVECGVIIDGKVDTVLKLNCDRCLKFFEYNISISFEEKFVNDNIYTYEGVHDLELKEDDFVEELKGRQEINVTDLIYQNIIINVPGKKLCDESCNGLEVTQELNKSDEIDPRLQIFKDLSEQMDDNK